MCSKILASHSALALCNSLKNDPPGPVKPFQFRPYQVEIGTAVMDSVFCHKGITFSVEIARQGGKNELSAQNGSFTFNPFYGRKQESHQMLPRPLFLRL